MRGAHTRTYASGCELIYDAHVATVVALLARKKPLADRKSCVILETARTRIQMIGLL